MLRAFVTRYEKSFPSLYLLRTLYINASSRAYTILIAMRTTCLKKNNPEIQINPLPIQRSDKNYRMVFKPASYHFQQLHYVFIVKGFEDIKFY